MDKETTTSVTIERKTFTRLDRLAKSNNVSKKEFLSYALNYFEKYGINPVEHESPGTGNAEAYQTHGPGDSVHPEAGAGFLASGL